MGTARTRRPIEARSERPGVAVEAHRGGHLTSRALIGRDFELELLTNALAGSGGVVSVQGEAGVGKSRLVADALDRAELQSVRKLVGRCHPVHEPFLLGPVVEALRTNATELPLDLSGAPILGALGPLLPELANRFPPPLPALGDATGERHRVFRAILDLLATLAPTVLVLEDLHWADVSTGDFLAFALPQLPEGVAIVLTYRRDELPEHSALQNLKRACRGRDYVPIELAPLTPAGTRHLVGALLDTPEVSVEFADFLHEHTAGLPFAIEEVLLLLQERQDLVQRDGRWIREVLTALPVPDSVRASVIQRMQRLPLEAQRLLQAAAVLGEETTEEIAAPVASLARRRFAGALAHSLASSLLQEPRPGRYTLRHALAREAIYDSLAIHERVDFHLRAAKALRTPTRPPLAQLAYHYGRARHTNEAARYALDAAQEAWSLHDVDGACRILEDVLLVPGLSPTARTRVVLRTSELALHSVSAPTQQRAIGHLGRVLEDARLPTGTRGELRYRLGLLLDRCGDSVSACEQLELAVDELARRPRLAVQAVRALALPGLIDGPIEENLEWMDRALKMVERIDDPVVRAMVQVDHAATLMNAGDPAADEIARGIPWNDADRGVQVEIARACLNFAFSKCSLGHYAASESYSKRGLLVAEELGHVPWRLALQACDILRLLQTGPWDGLEAQALQLWDEARDFPRARQEADLALGTLLLARGRGADATAHLSAAMEGAAQSLAHAIFVQAAARLTQFQLSRRQSRAALSTASGALAAIRGRGILAMGEIAPLVQTVVECRRPDHAAEIVDELAEESNGKDAPNAHASLLFCRGILAYHEDRPEEAVDLLEAAGLAYAELPRPYEAARALEVAGLIDSNPDRLLAALEGFVELGATWDAARVRRAIRTKGVSIPSPWRGGRVGYGDELSPREQEVARLAAEGLTGREIAEQLFLSRRTVEHHLESVMRKLGVESKSAALSELDTGTL